MENISLTNLIEILAIFAGILGILIQIRRNNERKSDEKRRNSNAKRWNIFKR